MLLQLQLLFFEERHTGARLAVHEGAHYRKKAIDKRGIGRFRDVFFGAAFNDNGAVLVRLNWQGFNNVFVENRLE